MLHMMSGGRNMLLMVCMTLWICGEGARIDRHWAAIPNQNVALFGLTGDGKSSLCNWLTGAKDACEVGHSLESATSSVSVTTHAWFNSLTLGNVSVADTPGLGDTKGRDASQWTAACKSLKKKLGTMDAAILVVNAAQQRMNDDRKLMLQVMRDTFGIDLWNHFAVVFTHFPWGNPPFGNDKAALEKKANAWRKFFKELELKREVWKDPKHKLMIEQQIDDVPFYGVELHPAIEVVSVVGEGSEIAPDSAAYMGLPQLTELRDWMVARQATEGSLDLADLHPRMGPSEVTPGQQFRCLLPKPCTITVKGKHLSTKDQVRITPIDQECGSEVLDSAVESDVPIEFPQKQSALGNNQERTFDLGETRGATGKFHVCYCESGKCDIPERFAQNAGELVLDAVECNIPDCPPHVDSVSRPKLTMDGVEQLSCPEALEEFKVVKYPHAIEYHCATGFAVAGKHGAWSYSRECLNTGALTPDTQLCEPLQCGYAPPVPHAEPRSTAVLVVGDIVEYQCKPTYTLTGHPDGDKTFERACNEDGNFTTEEVIEKGCRRWELGEWSECDTDCGTGNQTRDAYCSTGDDSDCDPAGKPHLEKPCERYTGCDGCAFNSDCQEMTVNDLLKRSGFVPSVVLGFLPTVSTKRLSPVTTCLCTDQCFKDKEKLSDLKLDLAKMPLSDPIHESCFYDTNAKSCGCLHAKTITGNTWKVVGGGLCQDAHRRTLGYGYKVTNKETVGGGLLGRPLSFRGCKKLCMQDDKCQGVYYSASKTWLPGLGTDLSRGTSQCFVYTTSSPEEQEDSTKSLGENYVVKLYAGVSGEIAGSAGSAKNLGQIGMHQVHDWVATDMLGGWALPSDTNGHCYKLLKQ